MTGTPPSAATGPYLRTGFIKWLVLALLAYWAIYALVAPVTIYDSHVYNLARLLIIQKAGFFGNRSWNTSAQISYPWAFDAEHYPFLFLGAGFDLPSFACMLGLLLVIHQLVGRRYGAVAAWSCDLAVLAMPTVVFEAASTKNDLAGVFGAAVWFYALCLWQERRRPIYLLWMALALAFQAGAKLSGPPIVAILSLYTFWRLRAGSRRQMAGFAVALAVFFLLFGSAETYLNNYLLFKNPLGDPEYIRFHRNIDGLAGGAANFIRYLFGNVNVGVDAFNPHSPFPGWMESACHGVLNLLGLTNVGYRRDFNDGNFQIVKLGLEAASDYGPVGTLALLVAFWLVVSRPWSDPLWKISAVGLAALAETCLTVGWMPWNNRFLLLPFILFGLAAVLFLLEAGPYTRVRTNLLLLVLVYSALVYPLCSFNKRPLDIQAAVIKRESLTLSERPSMKEVVDVLKARVRAGQAAPLLLTAGQDSWTYDVMMIRHLNVLPTPQLTHEALLAAQAKTGAPRLLVLTLNHVLSASLAAELTPLNVFGESDTTLFEWSPAGAPQAASSEQKLLTHFTEGWFAEEGAGTDRFRWMSAVGKLTVASQIGGTLIVDARLHSISPDNTVELVVDDQPAASATAAIGLAWQRCSLRAPLAPGVHQISLRSRQPAIQPPGDNRVLAVCAADVHIRVEP